MFECYLYWFNSNACLESFKAKLISFLACILQDRRWRGDETAGTRRYMALSTHRGLFGLRVDLESFCFNASRFLTGTVIFSHFLVILGCFFPRKFKMVNHEKVVLEIRMFFCQMKSQLRFLVSHVQISLKLPTFHSFFLLRCSSINQFFLQSFFSKLFANFRLLFSRE